MSYGPIRFSRLLLLVVTCFTVSTATANATLLSSDCGPTIRSWVRTQNAATTITSQIFLDVPGAVATFNIPGGIAPKCIKVRFYGMMACGDSIYSKCLIQAVLNGVPLTPTMFGNGADGLQPLSNAFEWHRRLGPGTYVLKMRWRVRAGDHLDVSGWTFDAELTQ